MDELLSEQGAGGSTRIGVNLTWLRPGKVGGSEEYTLRLLHGVFELAPANLDLQLYVRADLAAAYPGLADSFATEVMPKVGSRPARVAMEATWLSRASAEVDLVHHAGGTVPLTGSRPCIVTIHDLQPLEFPENFSPIKRRWLARMLPLAVRSSRLVLCPSRFTAERVADRLEVSWDKLRVIPHGYEAASLGQEAADVDEERTRRLLNGVTPGLADRRFLLYPAIAYPHKRHVDLVHALQRLAPDRPDLHVVFTGTRGPASAEVAKAIAASGVGDRIHVTGRVASEVLAALYRSAAALVFPSEYEGFGNPALEAMEFGCPIVAARAGSLPEVVGDAAVLYTPRQVEELVGCIERVLDDPALVTALVAKGRQRSGDYSTSRAARALVAAYRQAASGAVAERMDRESLV